jgi:hypothetical protein
MTGKQCKQCILPEGYPGVTFNEQGICSHCQTYKLKDVLEENVLWETIAKRPGTTYDVLVPASGGRDSTFVLYHAAKKCGKKVFALHFDNGFQVEQARINFLETVHRLGIDYTIAKSKYGFPEKIVRQAVKSALPFSLFDITTNCCVACTYGYRAASYREAVFRGIPTILWGDSDAEAISFAYRQNRAKYLFSRRFYNYLLFMVYTMLFQFEFWIPKSRFFHLGAPTYSGKDIVDLHFFDYIAWDRREIKATIMEKLGWTVPPGTISSWRFDCTIHNVVNYCFKQTYGFSKDFDGFANMVRAGKMDKKEALEHEEALGGMDQELVRILKEDFNLSDQELSRYFEVQTP